MVPKKDICSAIINVFECCHCFNYDVDNQQADEHQMLLSKFEVWASLPPVSVNSQQTSAIGDSTEYLCNLNFFAFLIQSTLLVHSFPIHTQIFCDLGRHFIPILLHLISDSSDSIAIPMQFLWRLHFWEWFSESWDHTFSAALLEHADKERPAWSN